MSKFSLSSVVEPKGSAAPATLEPRKEASKQALREPIIQGTKEESKEPRKRAWDNQDEWVKANYEVPKRVQTKLKEMKNWGYIGSLKDFVAQAIEREIDSVIAKAEKEGY